MATPKHSKRPALRGSRTRPKVKAPPPIPNLKHNERYTPEQVIAALRSARGMLSAAGQLLGCTRGTVAGYKDRYPAIDAVLTEEREMQLDRTELVLFKAIDKGELPAVFYYLKTQGRARGYVEKVDVAADALTLEKLVLLAQERRAARKATDAG